MVLCAEEAAHCVAVPLTVEAGLLQSDTAHAWLVMSTALDSNAVDSQSVISHESTETTAKHELD